MNTSSDKVPMNAKEVDVPQAIASLSSGLHPRTSALPLEALVAIIGRNGPDVTRVR
jgi:hypothetical protein